MSDKDFILYDSTEGPEIKRVLLSALSYKSCIDITDEYKYAMSKEEIDYILEGAERRTKRMLTDHFCGVVKTEVIDYFDNRKHMIGYIDLPLVYDKRLKELERDAETYRIDLQHERGRNLELEDYKSNYEQFINAPLWKRIVYAFKGGV